VGTARRHELFAVHCAGERRAGAAGRAGEGRWSAGVSEAGCRGCCYGLSKMLLRQRGGA